MESINPTSKDFENFGRDILKDWVEPQKIAYITSPINEPIMKIALKCGIAERVKYDPEIHGVFDIPKEWCIELKKGDDIWWWD